MPVLMAATRARAVGAAHAGWRGLAAGVVENGVRAVCELAGCEPAELDVWLGPCIGPRRFEVGADVLAAFGADPDRTDDPRFVVHRPGKWLASLPLVARERLSVLGVERVTGGDQCTFEDAAQFFSYRREGVTGRMAAAVWIES
jgi:YfiH family protein